MADRAQAPDTPAKNSGLSADQLADEQAQDLPDREAMSILSVGGLSGALPVPIDPQTPVGLPDPQPPVALPDPSAPLPYPPGVPTDVDLTNAGGNVGDISDVVDLEDVRTLMDPRDLADLRDVADVTGASVNGGIPASMVPPEDGSTTLA
jgi:hypothetical protein